MEENLINWQYRDKRKNTHLSPHKVFLYLQTIQKGLKANILSVTDKSSLFNLSYKSHLRSLTVKSVKDCT